MENLLEQMIEHYESLHDGDLHEIGLQPKMDCSGIWTEGFGSVILDAKGNQVKGISNKDLAYKLSKIKTRDDAVAQMREKISYHSKMVDSLKLTLSQYQRWALIDFSYNVGFGNLKISRLIALINTGHWTNSQIYDLFGQWVSSAGIKLDGLIFRRKTEATLFCFNKLQFYN